MDKSRNWKIRGPHTHQGSRTCQAAAQIPLQRGTCYQLWAPFQQSLATKQARPWSEGLGVCVDTRLLSLAVIALELVTGQRCGPTVPSAQSRLLPFLSFFLLPVLFCFPNLPSNHVGYKGLGSFHLSLWCRICRGKWQGKKMATSLKKR